MCILVNDISSLKAENAKSEEKVFEKVHIQNKPVYDFIKRIFDFVIALLMLVVLAVPLLIIALIIVIDSPGASPIYVQKRVGKNGREFKFYKFRSMVPDAEEMLESLLGQNEMNGPAFKIKEDPRITRFGRIIRKSCIDELPQLVNVLKGEMSLVGPRPPLPREVAMYDEYQMQRLLVIPGLTCYWQVTPERNSVSFDDWMKFDIKYIEERSLKTDFIILLKTVGTVFGMEGI